jgi:L-fuconolactonase
MRSRLKLLINNNDSDRTIIRGGRFYKQLKMLIDAHTHTWGEDTPELPWQQSVLPPGWDGSYTHQELVSDMDRTGLDGALVVSNALCGRGPRGNEYTMRSIEAHPDRLYGIGTMDWFGEDPARRLEQVVGHERMLGVRLYAAMRYDEVPTTIDTGTEWFLDERLKPAFDAAPMNDAVINVVPKPAQLDSVTRLVERHPDVTFVIDHMGWPDRDTDPTEEPWTQMEALADYTNVVVKVSSIPRSSSQPWPYTDMHGYLRELIEWYGPERLMLGSDYPWMDDWATYEECLCWIDTVDFCSRRDETYLEYRTFQEVHDLT